MPIDEHKRLAEARQQVEQDLAMLLERYWIRKIVTFCEKVYTSDKFPQPYHVTFLQEVLNGHPSATDAMRKDPGSVRKRIELVRGVKRDDREQMERLKNIADMLEGRLRPSQERQWLCVATQPLF